MDADRSMNLERARDELGESAPCGRLLRSERSRAEAGVPDVPRAGRKRHAFTLIELVTAMTVGVIISGLAGSLIWNASKQRAEIAARCELIDMGAVSLEGMIRYIREIPQDAASSGNAQIGLAQATELQFGSVGFKLDSGTNTLRITNDGAANWHTLAADVIGLAFTYFSRTGAVLSSFPLSAADRASVRRIQVDLQLDRSSQTAKLRNSIYLRNFMDEVGTDVAP